MPARDAPSASEAVAAEPAVAAPAVAESADVIGVGDIVRTEGLATVDFLKVDVDGPDVEVLESAREVLSASRVLGVGMEVNWFGTTSPTEHTFHNTDRFLREQGFTLFGMTTRRYSRTDLPAPFEREAFAFTRFGQPYQGDAIYLRDLAGDHLAGEAADYPADKLIKLACIYELAGLPDCAAEVLNRFRGRLTEFGDRESLLDALTPPLLGEQLRYREYIARFKRSPEMFLPSAAGEASASAPTPAAEAASAARNSPPPQAYRRLGNRIGRRLGNMRSLRGRE
ncbi:MAG: FkbM family methyltransferase, partial [Solirubrobacteraceae bacterium]